MGVTDKGLKDQVSDKIKLFPPLPERGYDEEAFYHPVSGVPVYCFLHRPSDRGEFSMPEGVSAPDGRGKAILIVSPFAEEKVKTYRIFVNIARLLSILGFHVMRFDYRGEGDSAENFEFADMRTRQEDTLELLSLLERLSGADRLYILGARLGATISTIAGVKAGATTLILWSPIVRPYDFLYNSLRANLATQMLIHRRVVRSREEMVRELEAGGSVNIDGYTIGAKFFLQCRDYDLIDFMNKEGKGWKGDLFILETSKVGRVTEELLNLFHLFDGRSERSEIKSVPREFSWNEMKFYNPRPSSLFIETLNWLKRVEG